MVGYRAQLMRSVAVHDCNPIFVELSKIHTDLYPQLIEAFRPGITVAELIDKSIAIGKKIAARNGPLTGAKASLIVHGRGLGDDRPLLLTNLDAKPMYEGTERAMDFCFPENGSIS